MVNIILNAITWLDKYKDYVYSSFNIKRPCYNHNPKVTLYKYIKRSEFIDTLPKVIRLTKLPR